MRDGLALERALDVEIRLFDYAEKGVPFESIMAALACKQQGREHLRELLHRRVLKPFHEDIDDEDRVDGMLFEYVA